MVDTDTSLSNRSVTDDEAAPRVTIGLPVFNGEEFLGKAIDSIFAQTFCNFELIICDNDSTDETGEICLAAADRDDRVRYHRNERNLGAAGNFNKCFALARGEFFKWQAHDDLLEPTYLEKCVAALDANPDAVQCHSLVGLIDAKGRWAGVYDSIVGSDSPRPARRFAAVILEENMASEIFALARRATMVGAPLHGTFHGSDTVHLAAMALRGRFLKIDEPLFLNRAHPGRYSEGVPIEDRPSWYSTEVPAPRAAQWSQYCGYLSLVKQEPLALPERLLCYGHLIRWWFVGLHAVKVLVDFASLLDPRIHRTAVRFKQRVFGMRRMGIDWRKWRQSK